MNVRYIGMSFLLMITMVFSLKSFDAKIQEQYVSCAKDSLKNFLEQNTGVDDDYLKIKSFLDEKDVVGLKKNLRCITPILLLAERKGDTVFVAVLLLLVKALQKTQDDQIKNTLFKALLLLARNSGPDFEELQYTDVQIEALVTSILFWIAQEYGFLSFFKKYPLAQDSYTYLLATIIKKNNVLLLELCLEVAGDMPEIDFTSTDKNLANKISRKDNSIAPAIYARLHILKIFKESRIKKDYKILDERLDKFTDAERIFFLRLAVVNNNQELVAWLLKKCPLLPKQFEKNMQISLLDFAAKRNAYEVIPTIVAAKGDSLAGKDLRKAYDVAKQYLQKEAGKKIADLLIVVGYAKHFFKKIAGEKEVAYAIAQFVGDPSLSPRVNKTFAKEIALEVNSFK